MKKLDSFFIPKRNAFFLLIAMRSSDSTRLSQRIQFYVFYSSQKFINKLKITFIWNVFIYLLELILTAQCVSSLLHFGTHLVHILHNQKDFLFLINPRWLIHVVEIISKRWLMIAQGKRGNLIRGNYDKTLPMVKFIAKWMTSRLKRESNARNWFGGDFCLSIIRNININYTFHIFFTFDDYFSPLNSTRV